MNVLTDKHYVKYKNVSRYSPFPVYYNNQDKKYISGITNYLENEETPFVSHVVKQGDTLDTLALYYYNSPVFFWVIADFNRITDAFEELEVGKVIRIPTFSRIEFKE